MARRSAFYSRIMDLRETSVTRRYPACLNSALNTPLVVCGPSFSDCRTLLRTLVDCSCHADVMLPSCRCSHTISTPICLYLFLKRDCFRPCGTCVTGSPMSSSLLLSPRVFSPVDCVISRLCCPLDASTASSNLIRPVACTVHIGTAFHRAKGMLKRLDLPEPRLFWHQPPGLFRFDFQAQISSDLVRRYRRRGGWGGE
ncbi:hypothetical protein VUR80DRAFT_1689 [Thermomyces stellatus]